MSPRLPRTEAQIPDPDEVVPMQVAFTVTETAIWLGFMTARSTGRAKYNAEARVRLLIREGHLRARGGRCKVISGGAIREYLAGDDSEHRQSA